MSNIDKNGRSCILMNEVDRMKISKPIDPQAKRISKPIDPQFS